MLKNIFYAIMLGAGMAACLSQNDRAAEDATTTSEAGAPTTDSPAQPLTPTPEQLEIKLNQVGFVSIGQDIKSMRQGVPSGFAIADTTLQQEGMQATAYIIRPEQQSKGFLVEQQCNPDCQVWRINVQSDAYSTPKGIRVGSAYSAVQQAHPISTVTLADGGLVAVAKEGGISFVLNAEQVPQNQRSRLTPETVPANTQVKAILVY